MEKNNMGENNNNNIRAGEQIFGMPESADVGQPKLQEISKEELERILGEHKKWLESEGKEGQKAILKRTNLRKANLKYANLKKASLWGADISDSDLGQADLSGANLSMANLQRSKMGFVNLRASILEKVNLHGAYLVGADLRNAYLGRADLREANLMEADFREADLSEATLEKAYLFDTELNDALLFDTNFNYVNLKNAKGLREAKLQYANLEKTTGLIGTELMQTDITGTKLPENYIAFNTLQVIEETSKNARKIFFAMLLGCVYSWLTIATTTDVNLLTNSASSPLPIIGTEIPIAWFFWVAPFVIICLYLYFHYYLNGLWEALSSLPAKFPDSKRLDERVYPWLLNKLVRRHFNLLQEGRPFIAHQQEWIIIFLAWWAVPLTFFGFWLRYLPRHDWFGTGLHIVFLILSVAMAIWFYRIAAIKLQAIKTKPLSKIIFWRDRRFYLCIIVVLTGGIFWILSDSTINGVRLGYGTKFGYFDIGNLKETIPYAFQKLGFSTFADFREMDVSVRPGDYYKIESTAKQIESVKGANLRELNLRYADMTAAFLVKADLRGANLQNADLRDANLERANLRGANLQEIDLSGTILRGADLFRADLSGGIKLFGADLSEANLIEADLRNAEFGLEEQEYRPHSPHPLIASSHSGKDTTDLQEEVLDYEKRFNFKGANLSKADLSGSKLQSANFGLADLKDAKLGIANLEDAYLIGAKNLSVDQLCTTISLYNTKLDSEVMEEVQNNCPKLLKKPNEREE